MNAKEALEAGFKIGFYKLAEGEEGNWEGTPGFGPTYFQNMHAPHGPRPAGAQLPVSKFPMTLQTNQAFANHQAANPPDVAERALPYARGGLATAGGLLGGAVGAPFGMAIPGAGLGSAAGSAAGQYLATGQRPEVAPTLLDGTIGAVGGKMLAPALNVGSSPLLSAARTVAGSPGAAKGMNRLLGWGIPAAGGTALGLGSMYAGAYGVPHATETFGTGMLDAGHRVSQKAREVSGPMAENMAASGREALSGTAKGIAPASRGSIDRFFNTSSNYLGTPQQ